MLNEIFFYVKNLFFTPDMSGYNQQRPPITCELNKRDAAVLYGIVSGFSLGSPREITVCGGQNIKLETDSETGGIKPVTVSNASRARIVLSNDGKTACTLVTVNEESGVYGVTCVPNN